MFKLVTIPERKNSCYLKNTVDGEDFIQDPKGNEKAGVKIEANFHIIAKVAH